MISRRILGLTVLTLIVVGAIVYLMTGCASNPYPTKRITHGNQTWISCRYIYGYGSITFYDQDGKIVKVYGDTTVEDASDYVCVNEIPVKK